MHLTTGVFLRRLLLRAVWALPIAGLITFGNFGLGHGTFYVAQTNATTTRGEPVTPEAHRPTAAPSAPSKRPASPKPASPKAASPAPAPPAPAKPAAPADLGRSWIASHGSPDLGLHAGAAVLLDPDSGQVLWERDPHSRRAPASLTKIVTVMVALDHAPPDRAVVVPDAAQPQPDWTAMGLTPGETVSVRDLLYGVFLLSGNDAAETLAQTLMPRDQFIAAMNAKVSEDRKSVV